MEEPAAKKIRINNEVSDTVNLIKVEILPREILCIIFLYLDKKSLRNATASCKLWFDLIRSDIKLSGYICFENFGVEALFRKLAIGKWNWARWPVLKTLKFGGMSAAKIQNISSKKMTSYISSESTIFCFKGCPTLEKVVISCSCTLTGIFPELPNSPLGIIEELTFDPKDDIESVGIEHVSRLKFVLDGSTNYKERFDTQAIHISENLKLLKSTAHNLKSMSIIGRDVAVINIYMSELFGRMTQDLKNLFEETFQELDKTLESVFVIVGQLCDIDYLFSDATPITEIWIESLDMQEICHCPHSRNQEIRLNGLTKLFQRFKKLRKCRVDLELTEEDLDKNCDRNSSNRRSMSWPKFVEKNFKDVADFNFRFVYGKQIVKDFQDENVLRLHRGSRIYKKVIRFEITRR